LPKELQGALDTLYSNYQQSYKIWEQQRTDYPDTILDSDNAEGSTEVFLEK